MTRKTWSWIALFVGELLEIAWASLLRQAQWLERPLLLTGGLALSLVSVALLGWAVRVLPLGTGYAAWIGLGAGGSVVAGLLFFGEPAEPPRLLLLAAIVVGLVGLQLTEPNVDEPPRRSSAR